MHYQIYSEKFTPSVNRIYRTIVTTEYRHHRTNRKKRFEAVGNKHSEHEKSNMPRLDILRTLRRRKPLLARKPAHDGDRYPVGTTSAETESVPKGHRILRTLQPAESR